MNDKAHILLDAISIARGAGQIQMANFRSATLKVETKDNEYDLVTAAD